eukprot:TRINITY_DN27019_c0_g1_i1.p1 TRINITY_DN27019_c0_g1~~TRINITY_DN27019_c0_g1_i1.p1  ORF type:complete len:116 (-),score=15.39 TRINITY_DN27019_c0_g1_i1:104-451(-)
MAQQPVCMYELDCPVLSVCGWGQGVVVATSNGLYTTASGELSLVPVPSLTGDGSVRGSYFNVLEWDREDRRLFAAGEQGTVDVFLSLIHISEPTRLLSISYAVFCLKKKKSKNNI